MVDEIPTAADEEAAPRSTGCTRGYAAWRPRPVADLAAIALRAAELFAERADELAAIMTLEMGKRINEGRGEAGVVATIFRYYGERGPELLADEPWRSAAARRCCRRSRSGRCWA
ncbi:aldehyde dehydrogenase family protein [Amycolatopsis sp. NPDC026612]|uniref:aldehyde dehydrogenase family protein n=1 Tax=Amycolatopsis sp. NPDC026612 TaxID=3155466 RepID=UPI0033EEB303